MKLGLFWAEKCDFSLLLQDEFHENVKKVRACFLPGSLFLERHFQLLSRLAQKFKLVAFTNGPREYALTVLDVLGLSDFLPKEKVFAVEDNKPFFLSLKESFQYVLQQINSKPEECLMIEDSIKNVRAANEFGIRTFLVTNETNRPETTVLGIEKVLLA